mmetsp:Transcript_17788/g.54395  ORF Transcript_17788/g.54395 Transcript_17788/m.54395 type:complete len:273 (-) Transcript_17788:414-1232(-)
MHHGDAIDGDKTQQSTQQGCTYSRGPARASRGCCESRSPQGQGQTHRKIVLARTVIIKETSCATPAKWLGVRVGSRPHQCGEVCAGVSDTCLCCVRTMPLTCMSAVWRPMGVLGMTVAPRRPMLWLFPRMRDAGFRGAKCLAAMLPRRSTLSCAAATIMLALVRVGISVALSVGLLYEKSSSMSSSDDTSSQIAASSFSRFSRSSTRCFSCLHVSICPSCPKLTTRRLRRKRSASDVDRRMGVSSSDFSGALFSWCVRMASSISAFSIHWSR